MPEYLGIRFREEQRFNQWWIRLLAVALVAAALGVFGTAFYQQLVLDEPFGDNPMPDAWLIGVGIAVILIAVGIAWLIFNAKLITEVRGDGVYYQFWPFFTSFHQIPFEELESFQSVEYSALKEYGGWGFRMSTVGEAGTALMTSGNKGLRFKMKDGEERLIGTQQPEDFALAVRQGLAGIGRR